MNRTHKILLTILWASAVLMAVSMIGAGLLKKRDYERTSPLVETFAVASAELPQAPLDIPVPAFSLINQNGEPVSNEDLKGHPWIAAFIFTHCAGPCPIMTSKMAMLQEAIASPEIKLVSFTVDPERDTPEVLKAYAAKFDADESRWHFLTGQTQAMYDVAAGMKISAVSATQDSPITHSDRFILVDADGKIYSTYRNSDPDSIQRIVKAVKEMTGGAAQ